MGKTPKLGLPLPSCTNDGTTFLEYRSDVYDSMMELDDIVGKLRKNPINTKTQATQADWAINYKGLDGHVLNRPFYQRSDGTFATIPFKYMPLHYMYYYDENKEDCAMASKHLTFRRPGDLVFILMDADLVSMASGFM